MLLSFDKNRSHFSIRCCSHLTDGNLCADKCTQGCFCLNTHTLLLSPSRCWLIVRYSGYKDPRNDGSATEKKKKKHPRIYILLREFSEVTVCSRQIKWEGLIKKKKWLPSPFPKVTGGTSVCVCLMRGIKEHLHRRNHKKRWKAERSVTFKRFVTAGGRNAAQACHLQPRSVSAPLTGKTNEQAKNITQSNTCTRSLWLFSWEYYSICLSKTYGARHALSGRNFGDSSTNMFWSDSL